MAEAQTALRQDADATRTGERRRGIWTTAKPARHLLSGLAFAGLIYAIILQSRELAQQRKELRLQREEMAKSREQLTEQARAQQNSLKVTIAQLRITALQADIRAEEVESLENAAGSRALYVAKIRDLCREMHQRIDEIAQDVQKV